MAMSSKSTNVRLGPFFKHVYRYKKMVYIRKLRPLSELLYVVCLSGHGSFTVQRTGSAAGAGHRDWSPKSLSRKRDPGPQSPGHGRDCHSRLLAMLSAQTSLEAHGQPPVLLNRFTLRKKSISC